MIFLVFTRREFCSSNSLKWAKVLFSILIIALLVKSSGYVSSGCAIIEYNNVIKQYPKCP